MNKQQLTKLRQDLYNIKQLVDQLQSEKRTSEKTKLTKKIDCMISEIKPKLPGKNDTSYSAAQLNADFAELVESYKDIQTNDDDGEHKEDELFGTFTQENIDFEEEKKKVELDDIREVTQLSSELMKRQAMINEQLQKDSESLEAGIIDTETTISASNKMMRDLGEASKEERKKRGMYFTVGTTAVGGIVGSGIGAIVGAFSGGVFAKWIGKKHDKKIEKVANMK